MIRWIKEKIWFHTERYMFKALPKDLQKWLWENESLGYREIMRQLKENHPIWYEIVETHQDIVKDNRIRYFSDKYRFIPELKHEWGDI